MNEFISDSDNLVLHRFLKVLIEQMDAPINEVKMWLLSTPSRGSIEETQTMIHLLERTQEQVKVQLQLLEQFLQKNLYVTDGTSTPVFKMDESQLEQLLGIIQSSVEEQPIAVDFPPLVKSETPIQTIMLKDEEFDKLMECLGNNETPTRKMSVFDKINHLLASQLREAADSLSPAKEDEYKYLSDEDLPF